MRTASSNGSPAPEIPPPSRQASGLRMLIMIPNAWAMYRPNLSIAADAALSPRAADSKIVLGFVPRSSSAPVAAVEIHETRSAGQVLEGPRDPAVIHGRLGLEADGPDLRGLSIRPGNHLAIHHHASPDPRAQGDQYEVPKVPPGSASGVHRWQHTCRRSP